MSSRFYLSSPTSSTSSLSSTDSTSLPFPKPLSRSAFLTPDFDPTTFLSSLTSRFQTLEDLRSELVALSQTIQTELVDLVNDNYADFLKLGTSLAGGEEKIEEVRVGLLGFERDVQSLRGKVEKERGRVSGLMSEKKSILQEIAVGRGLLEVEERVEELELDLGLKERKVAAAAARGKGEEDQQAVTEEWSEDWNDDVVVESDDEYDEKSHSAVPLRLRRRTEQFLTIMALTRRFEAQQSFLATEHGRIRKIRETLLLDLDAAIRAEPDVKGKQEIITLRGSMEE